MNASSPTIHKDDLFLSPSQTLLIEYWLQYCRWDEPNSAPSIPPHFIRQAPHQTRSSLIRRGILLEGDRLNPGIRPFVQEAWDRSYEEFWEAHQAIQEEMEWFDRRYQQFDIEWTTYLHYHSSTSRPVRFERFGRRHAQIEIADETELVVQFSLSEPGMTVVSFSRELDEKTATRLAGHLLVLSEFILQWDQVLSNPPSR